MHHLQMFQIQKLSQWLNDIAGHLDVVRVQWDHFIRTVVQSNVTFIIQAEHMHSEIPNIIIGLRFNIVREQEILRWLNPIWIFVKEHAILMDHTDLVDP